MRHRWTRVALLAVALPAACGGCRRDQPPARLRVFVTILPQAYLAERIGGRHVDVSVLVGPGQSPHTFDMTLKQAVELSESQLYFRIGIPLETRIVEKIAESAKHLKIVDTDAGIQRRTMPPHGHHAGEDDRGEPDPHVWLDPKLAKQQAAIICRALAQTDPAHEQDYRSNFEALADELDAVDRRIAEMLRPFRGRSIYVFHPAYGYFAAAYGLNQHPVEAEGKSPAAKQVLALIQQAEADGVKVIFDQPQFADRSAQIIAEQIGGRVVHLDPLAKDYVRNLEHMAAEIRRALAGGQSHQKEQGP